MSELTDALDRLMLEHRRIGSPVPDFLRPGSEPAKIRKRIAALGLEPPDDAIELFSWHDGSDNGRYVSSGAGVGYPRIFDDVFFGTIDEAVAYYRKCLQIDRDVAGVYADDADRIWQLSWFPPFSGGLPTYGIECDPASPARGRIFEPWWHPPIEDPIRPRFRNLTHLVESVVRRFEAGAYSWDEATRFLDSDFSVLDRLEQQERHEAAQ